MLCMVAGHPVAVLARDVTRIDDVVGHAPYAGPTFAVSGAAPSSARSLWAAERGVSVDAVEVLSDPPTLLPAPTVLGGATPWIVGFAQVKDRLWPVVSLPGWHAAVAAEGAA